MGGGSKGSSTSQQNIPDELKPLYADTGTRVRELQGLAQAKDFTGSSPLRIAPLSGTQQYASNLVREARNRPLAEALAFRNLEGAVDAAGRRVTGEGIENAPAIKAAQRAFEINALPGIQNQMTLAGLGRSTAGADAVARQNLAYLSPLISEELAREDARNARLAGVLQGTAGQYGNLGAAETGRTFGTIEAAARQGEVERGAEQDTYTAAKQDELRRQALAEQALFGPLNQLPSTFGQTTSSRGGGGGLFK